MQKKIIRVKSYTLCDYANSNSNSQFTVRSYTLFWTFVFSYETPQGLYRLCLIWSMDLKWGNAEKYKLFVRASKLRLAPNGPPWPCLGEITFNLSNCKTFKLSNFQTFKVGSKWSTLALYWRNNFQTFKFPNF